MISSNNMYWYTCWWKYEIFWNYHAALPEPKTGVGSSLDENDVLEDEVKPKTSQTVDAPKPPPKKPKQPVRFTISAHNEVNLIWTFQNVADSVT